MWGDGVTQNPKSAEDILAAPQGFEPRYAAPEAAVLPLNEGAEDIDSLTGYHNPKFARHDTGPLERLFTLSVVSCRFSTA
jgi:hypothetical protein